MGEQDKAPRLRRDLQIAGQAERPANLAVDNFADPSGRVFIGDLGDQPEGLRVGQLVKVVIEGADAVEGPGRLEADDLVGLAAHLLEGVGGRHRNGQDHLGRALTPERPQGRLGGGAGGQSVVNHDRRAPGRADTPPAAEIDGAPPLDLRKLAISPGLQERHARPGHRAHLLVDHELRLIAIDDSGEGEFRLAGGADLADHDQVEGRVQHLGDLDSDGHAAAWQGVDHGPVSLERQKA